MGAALCVGAPQRWVRRVVGVGLVSVSTVCLAAVCRVSSSAAPLGGLLWWCLGGGLGLCGSWEGAGHAGLGWLEGGGARVCGLACLPSVPPVAPSSACPLLLSFRWLVWLCFFFWGGGVAGVLYVGVGVKVLPWVVVGAGGLGAGKTSGAGTRGVSLDVVIGVGTGYTNTNGGESSDNRSKVHADCGPAENPSL